MLFSDLGWLAWLLPLAVIVYGYHLNAKYFSLTAKSSVVSIEWQDEICLLRRADGASIPVILRQSNRLFQFGLALLFSVEERPRETYAVLVLRDSTDSQTLRRLRVGLNAKALNSGKR